MGTFKMKSCILLLVFAFFNTCHGLCRDVTLDDCTNGDKPAFESTKGVNQLICQQICHEIYPTKCTFFIYDRQQEICELFDSAIEDYPSSCTKIAGPRDPDVVDECPDQDDCTVDTCFVLFFVSFVLFKYFF